MALIAMTTSDQLDYVSILDPAKKLVKKPVKQSEADLAAGLEEKEKFVEEFEIGPGATVFKLRGLDVFLMGHIYDNASSLSGKSGSDEVGIHTKVNATNLETVRHGLMGFVNFADSKGGQVVYKTEKAVVNGRKYDVVSEETMNALGIRLIQELSSEVKRISEVSRAEEKNSVGA
jgi:hypothetical protein